MQKIKIERLAKVRSSDPEIARRLYLLRMVAHNFIDEDYRHKLDNVFSKMWSDSRKLGTSVAGILYLWCINRYSIDSDNPNVESAMQYCIDYIVEEDALRVKGFESGINKEDINKAEEIKQGMTIQYLDRCVHL